MMHVEATILRQFVLININELHDIHSVNKSVSAAAYSEHGGSCHFQLFAHIYESDSLGGASHAYGRKSRANSTTFAKVW